MLPSSWRAGLDVGGRHTYLFLHIMRDECGGGGGVDCADCAPGFFFVMAAACDLV